MSVEKWDATHKHASMTLDGTKLIATAGASGPWQPVYGDTPVSSGKFYWEVVFTSGSRMVGIAKTTTAVADDNYIGFDNSGIGWSVGSGSVLSNGSVITSIAGGLVGDAVGIALDLDNNKIWFRADPSSNWNGSGTDNPATNTGGISLTQAGMAIVPSVVPGAAMDTTSQTATAAFDAASWAGSAPSGFLEISVSAILPLPLQGQIWM